MSPHQPVRKRALLMPAGYSVMRPVVPVPVPVQILRIVSQRPSCPRVALTALQTLHR